MGIQGPDEWDRGNGLDLGSAGASARAEFERRRANDDIRRRQRFGRVLASLVKGVAGETPSTEVTGAAPSRRAVLCFVDAEWRLLSRSFTIDDVIVTSMRPLAAALRGHGPLHDAAIWSLARRISAAFPSYDDVSLRRTPRTPQ